MCKLIILVGNVGTGKTKYRVEHFKNDEVIICPDEWRDLSKTKIGIKLITGIESALTDGKTVVWDGNNMDRTTRAQFDDTIGNAGGSKTIIDFGKGTKVSLDSRINNSREESAEFWTGIHNENQIIYEKPTLDECDKLIVIN